MTYVPHILKKNLHQITGVEESVSSSDINVIHQQSVCYQVYVDVRRNNIPYINTRVI